ncbi:unnamed protein product [Cuscuta epithymum]|uniref:Uncharacterized protein n=1 Tax=Cuscuta epithymum TaxID=186058 RepID=A0AAV0ETQ5_9ASTE|nr:unnamed protein product [Cuscuta epithymum]CAH9126617.1 unnamed protein product [Cuscuta epithymum]
MRIWLDKMRTSCVNNDAGEDDHGPCVAARIPKVHPYRRLSRELLVLVRSASLSSQVSCKSSNSSPSTPDSSQAEYLSSQVSSRTAFTSSQSPEVSPSSPSSPQTVSSSSHSPSQADSYILQASLLQQESVNQWQHFPEDAYTDGGDAGEEQTEPKVGIIARCCTRNVSSKYNVIKDLEAKLFKQMDHRGSGEEYINQYMMTTENRRAQVVGTLYENSLTEPQVLDADRYVQMTAENYHNWAIKLGSGSLHYIQVGDNRGASGIDGFRLYVVTSMMCNHLGLVLMFTADYNDYFGHATKVDVVVYRMLVNNLIHNYPVTNSELSVISGKTLETVGATIIYDDQLPHQFKSTEGLMQVICCKGVHFGGFVFEAHLASILWNHCDDAPGEETANFQRCSYWLLEEEQSNIVVVHDREVKGSRRNHSRAQEPPLVIPACLDGKRDVNSSDVGITLGNLIPQQYYYQTKAHATHAGSLNSAQASDYEQAKTAVHNQLSTPGMHSFTEFLAIMNPKGEDELSAPYFPSYILIAHQGHFPAVCGFKG